MTKLLLLFLMYCMLFVFCRKLLSYTLCDILCILFQASAKRNFDETLEAHVNLGIDRRRSDLVLWDFFYVSYKIIYLHNSNLGCHALMSFSHYIIIIVVWWKEKFLILVIICHFVLICDLQVSWFTIAYTMEKWKPIF